AVLGVAEGAVLRQADTVTPAVAGQREHRRGVRGGREQEHGRGRDQGCESSRHADTIGTRVQGLELGPGKDRAAAAEVISIYSGSKDRPITCARWAASSRSRRPCGR